MHAVVARNHRRVDRMHRGAALFAAQDFSHTPLPPARAPAVEGRRTRQRQQALGFMAGSRFAQRAEHQRVVGGHGVHGVQQVVGQGLVALPRGRQPQLPAHAVQPRRGSPRGHRLDHCTGCGEGGFAVLIDHGQQRLRQSRHVPAHQRRLVGKRIAARAVDRTEHLARVVVVQEGAGPVVDSLARQRGVVGVHHPVDEAHVLPLRHQRRLPARHGFQQRQVRTRRVRGLRVMAGDDVVGQLAHAVGVAARGEILEGTDAHVAGRHARQHRAGHGTLAEHVLAGGHRRKCPRGRHAHRVHRFADQVFAQHRADGGAAVAVARERSGPGALELQVAALAAAVDQFTQQDGAAVAKLRHEVAELVAGVGHRQRQRARRNDVAGEHSGGVGAAGKTQLGGQGVVERQQVRRLHRRGIHALPELSGQLRVGVFEIEMAGAGLSGHVSPCNLRGS